MRQTIQGAGLHNRCDWWHRGFPFLYYISLFCGCQPFVCPAVMICPDTGPATAMETGPAFCVDEHELPPVCTAQMLAAAEAEHISSRLSMVPALAGSDCKSRSRSRERTHRTMCPYRCPGVIMSAGSSAGLPSISLKQFEASLVFRHMAVYSAAFWLAVEQPGRRGL